MSGIDKTQQHQIVPVILCGGSGTRLWLLSRKLYPKPFVRRSSGGSRLFEETLERATRLDNATTPLVVSNEEYRFYVLEALEQLQIDATIILEPEGRNTAPELALAALAIMEKGDAMMLAMPADHSFENEAAFREIVARAILAASVGHIVTFGIKPVRQECGYGCIHQSEKKRSIMKYIPLVILPYLAKIAKTFACFNIARPVRARVSRLFFRPLDASGAISINPGIPLTGAVWEKVEA